MNELQRNGQYYTHSRKNILVSTVIAALLAMVILATIVLPVEYNIDPTGIGARLGLTVLATGKMEPSPVTTVPDAQQATPAGEQFAQLTDVAFRSETIEIPMQGDEELEYKFHMKKGRMLFYSWDSGAAEMYYEFHAEPTAGEYPEGYYMSYQIGDGVSGASGTLVAPFTGNHGWYFLNLTGKPVTVKLRVSGYYTSHGRL